MYRPEGSTITVAIREEVSYLSPAIWMGKPIDCRVSQSNEHCFISGKKAEAILRFARAIGAIPR